MFDDLSTSSAFMICGVTGLLGWLSLALVLAKRWDTKKRCRSSLESLRDCLCQARGLIEQQPEKKDAKVTYDRANLIYTLIDNGFETNRDPNDILRAVASEVGVEMAIHARFQAGARK